MEGGKLPPNLHRVIYYTPNNDQFNAVPSAPPPPPNHREEYAHQFPTAPYPGISSSIDVPTPIYGTPIYGMGTSMQYPNPYQHRMQSVPPHSLPVVAYPNGGQQLPYCTNAPTLISPNDPYSALSAVNMLIIEQQSHLLEAVTQGVIEESNEYKILTNEGVHILNVKEESGCFVRMCCHPNHDLTLHLTSPSSNPMDTNNDIFSIHKPFKCCCCACCSCCQKEMTMRRHFGSAQPPQVLAFVKQPVCGGCCRPQLDIYDRRYGSFLGSVSGPCCCIGGFFDTTFDVSDSSGAALGKIERKGVKDLMSGGRLAFTDSDKYALSFPSNIDAKMKATLFGTLLFVDYLFFEEEGNVECNPFRPSCKLKCCDIYCCGSTIPCKCNCGDSRP